VSISESAPTFALVRATIARYVSLTDAEFGALASRLTVRQLRKGEHLLRAGEVCQFEGFVNQGCLRVYAIDERGDEHVLSFATEGAWVSDLESFLHQTPAALNIDATETSEALLIDRAAKEDLYLEVPKFERMFRIMVQMTHSALEQRLIAWMSQPADRRYLELTKREPHIHSRVPQHQIASYLGISPEFLSKIRRRLTR